MQTASFDVSPKQFRISWSVAVIPETGPFLDINYSGQVRVKWHTPTLQLFLADSSLSRIEFCMYLVTGIVLSDSISPE